jgi:hypothetical protein
MMSSAVGKQVALLILDVPFPILIILTLWRLPWLIPRLIKEVTCFVVDKSVTLFFIQCSTGNERRLMVLRYVLLVLIDIPCIILFVIILITVWRIPTLIKLFKTVKLHFDWWHFWHVAQYQSGDNEHKLLGKLFLQLLIDVPFVLMGIFVFCTSFYFRFPFMIRAIYRVWIFRNFVGSDSIQCTDDPNDEDSQSVKRRVKALQYFGAVWSDLLCLILGVIVVLTVWRIPTAIHIYKQKRSDRIGEYWAHVIFHCLSIH